MTEQTKVDQLAAELGIDATKLKLALQSASGKDINEGKPKRSPDGGPISSWRDASPQTCPTVKVEDKETGAVKVINADKFDERKHKMLRVKLAEEAPTADKKKDAPAPLKRENIETLTIPQLKELPQFKALDDATGLRTKEDILNALVPPAPDA